MTIWTDTEVLKRDAIIMANARRLIKAKKITSNGRLASELFGYGCFGGLDRAKKLGLDPNGNETSYTVMMDYINDQPEEA